MARCHQDAFAKYSNDATRLKTLLLRENDKTFDVNHFSRKHYITGSVNINGGNALSRSSSTQTSTTENCEQTTEKREARIRKTKISFELHPSLIIDEEDIFGTENLTYQMSKASDFDVLSQTSEINIVC